MVPIVSDQRRIAVGVVHRTLTSFPTAVFDLTQRRRWSHVRLSGIVRHAMREAIRRMGMLRRPEPASKVLFREPNKFVLKQDLQVLRDELRRLEADFLPGADTSAVTFAGAVLGLVIAVGLYGISRITGIVWSHYYSLGLLATAVSIGLVRYRFISCEHAVPGGRTHWKCLSCRAALLKRIEWLSDAIGRSEYLLLLGGVRERERFLEGEQQWEEEAEKRRLRNAERAAEEERLARIEAETNRQLAATLGGLCQIDPRGFEELVAELYAALGWDVRLTPMSGDDGIDVTGVREGMRLAVQCKRYAVGRTVGSPEIQALLGAAKQSAADVVVFVTTSSFSRQARGAAKKLGVDLVDGPDLVRLFHQAGVCRGGSGFGLGFISSETGERDESRGAQLSLLGE